MVSPPLSLPLLGFFLADAYMHTATPGHALANLLFAMALLSCAWNLFRAATLEPGFAPVAQSEGERRLVVQQLADQGRLNGMNYCVVCMVSRYLRRGGRG